MDQAQIPIGKLMADVPDPVYRSWPAPSYSLLKHVGKTPAHALSQFMHPPDQTPAMLQGTLTHLAILEPEKFQQAAVRRPPGIDKRTKDGKAAWAALEAQYPHAEIMDKETMDRIEGMAAAAWAHPVALAALQAEQRMTEASLAWEEIVDDVPMVVKARLDLLSRMPNGETWVIDVKTTKDASPKGFAREVVNYSYVEQASWYLRGLNALATANRRWLWIAVENTPPYAVGVYEPYDSDIAAAEARMTGYLETWERCRRTESWPGYSTEIEPLVLPDWAYRV